ncbi:MAG: hypothetical protein K0R68_233 [Mycobacterium sp.]|nr:hypothetical protein [Mycobacterium sp.]
MMDVQPAAVGLSSATEAGITASMAASASSAAPALLGATPMGMDGDSAAFAAALNAAGAAYLATAAEHAGQRSAYAGAQSLASATYSAADVITKSAFLTP